MKNPARPEPENTTPARRPYAEPHLERIELTLEETLAEGCKAEGNFDCSIEINVGS